MLLAKYVTLFLCVKAELLIIYFLIYKTHLQPTELELKQANSIVHMLSKTVFKKEIINCF